MKLQIIIVDDEKLSIMDVQQLLEERPEVEVAAVFQAPAKALEYIRRGGLADVGLFDIRMPVMSGLELAERIGELRPAMEFVFLTAYNEYALEAFNVNALDYLLKPINKQRFELMLNRVCRRLKAQEAMPQSGRMAVQLFQQFNISVSGVPLLITSNKAAELIALLLLNRDRSIHKERIIELMWQHDGSIGVRTNNLRAAVCRARQALASTGSALQIKFCDDGYRIICQQVSLDTDEFDKLLKAEQPDKEQLARIYGEGLLFDNAWLWAHSYAAEYERRYNKCMRGL